MGNAAMGILVGVAAVSVGAGLALLTVAVIFWLIG